MADGYDYLSAVCLQSKSYRGSGPGSDQTKAILRLKEALLGDGDKGNSPWLYKMLRIKDSWGINLR